MQVNEDEMLPPTLQSHKSDREIKAGDKNNLEHKNEANEKI